MRLRFVYKIVSLFICFWFSFGLEAKVLKESSSTKVAPRPIDFFVPKKMELIKELDEVMREMIWLIRRERPAANRTLFGKVYRALQQSKGVRLTEKNKHSCDQNEIEKVAEFQFLIYEHCQKHRAPDLLARINWSQNQVTMEFQGQNYSDVLGMAAALVAPKVSCQVQLNNGQKLSGFNCTGLRITRAENVVRFENISFRKGKNPLMVLKGEVLKNLLPFSDLLITVPSEGKVSILEKKKTPDSDETTKEIDDMLKAGKTMERLPPQPLDPKVLMPMPMGPGPIQVPRPPRETEDSDTATPAETEKNNDLIKNSDPDLIPVQENQPSR